MLNCPRGFLIINSLNILSINSYLLVNLPACSKMKHDFLGLAGVNCADLAWPINSSTQTNSALHHIIMPSQLPAIHLSVLSSKTERDTLLWFLEVFHIHGSWWSDLNNWTLMPGGKRSHKFKCWIMILVTLSLFFHVFLTQSGSQQAHNIKFQDFTLTFHN